jgi:hypothetical protein
MDLPGKMNDKCVLSSTFNTLFFLFEGLHLMLGHFTLKVLFTDKLTILEISHTMYFLLIFHWK